MFEYKNYRIFSYDDENVELQQLTKVENTTLTGTGKKGRGKGLGTFRDEWKVVGWYQSFKGALEKVADLMLQKGEDVAEIKAIIEEIKTVLVPLARVYQKKIYDEVREKVKQSPVMNSSLLGVGVEPRKRGRPKGWRKN